jgi:hypothetical protein
MTDNDKVKNEEQKLDQDEELELSIPSIPEAPKKKKISIESPGLSADLLNKIKNLEKKDNMVVLVNCERCKEIIPVPIPIKFIKKSKIPVVPISFIHKNSHGKDRHCITLHLDHDFDIRRQRISDVVFSQDL